MAVSVCIEGLTKTFGGTRAVDDVSLTVEPGELFFLLGPSGCGKTTLLRCIAGFYEPDAGSICIGARDVTRLPPHRRDTGMVFQSYALWPHMTIGENVAFGLEMRKIAKSEIARRVAEVLETVRMGDRAGDRPNQLSGGQQQRVALARALVIRPQRLLLDEPLSNLDAKLRMEMRTEIRRICKAAGLTAIYVTHDQKEALSIADRLAVIDDGRIRQVGAPREVYVGPQSRFVAGFVGETNFLNGTVVSVEDGTLRVHTAIGPVTSAAAPGVAAGASVTISIRPEVIRFDTPPPGVSNVFNGWVRDTVYLGEVAQHSIDLPGADSGGEGATLMVFDMNPKIVARDAAKEAQVWIAPGDVVVLAE